MCKFFESNATLYCSKTRSDSLLVQGRRIQAATQHLILDYDHSEQECIRGLVLFINLLSVVVPCECILLLTALCSAYATRAPTYRSLSLSLAGECICICGALAGTLMSLPGHCAAYFECDASMALIKASVDVAETTVRTVANQLPASDIVALACDHISWTSL